jgi:replicative DNA helicase Mcm
MTNYSQLFSDTTKPELMSVSEALRKPFGKVRCEGAIMGISKIFNMVSKVSFYCDYCQKLTEVDFTFPEFDEKYIKKRCDKCNKPTTNDINPEFKSAVIVELQDTNSFNELDRLPIFLFDDDTKDIRVGEKITVTGSIQILKNNTRRYSTYLYSESIKYQSRDDLTLTKLDIEAIKRFRDIKGEAGIIDGLVSIFDHSIVGYEHVKKGILCSAVNTSTSIENSEHIDILLIGDPGLAKTKLLGRATELVPGSSKESAQNSSGKSITAIVEKTEDNTFLRSGAIPRARGAICGLNELGRMSIEDQSHLLDVMEEREFTINKHGINARIGSPTAIIGSANPVNRSKWKDDDKVDLNEFPILGPLLDRLDLIFVFRTIKDPNDIRKFGKRYSKMLSKKQEGKLPDYIQFLTKYISYARKLNPILTEEAIIMLEEFYIDIKIKGFGSDRVLPTLHKLAKAVARLKLKEIVEEEDAKEVMEFYNVMLSEFQKNVVVSQTPKETAYKKCIDFLKNIDRGITVEELIKLVCEGDEQLAYYFGYNKEKSLKMRNNIKIRDLCDRLLNHSEIKRVQEKPVVLQWLCDPCDVCDSDLGCIITKNNFNDNDSDSESGSHRSHGSHNEEADENTNEYVISQQYITGKNIDSEPSNNDLSNKENNKKISIPELSEQSYSEYQ